MRSPLFSLVRRSMLLAQESLHDERPVDEIVGEAERRRSSRREFLAVSGAAAGAFVLSRCIPLAAPMVRPSAEPVVIIGAGIAGLTAAYRLKTAGIPVRIFEGQRRVGGRMWTLRDHFPNGQVAELGGELVDTGHKALTSLARELEIELDDLSTYGPALRNFWYFGGSMRTEMEIIEAFRPIAAEIERARSAAGDTILYDEHSDEAASLDLLSIEEWLRRAGVSGWIHNLIEVAFTTENGLGIGEQSALNLITMIGTSPKAFQPFGDSDKRFHIRGGSDLVIRRLAEHLQAEIETDSTLEAVRQRPDGGLVAHIRRGLTTIAVPAPHLLVTIPFTMLRQVELQIEMSPVKRRVIAELGYGSGSKLMAGFSRRVWTDAGSNGSTFSDRPWQSTWETSRLQPGASGILTNFTGGRNALAIGKGSASSQAARLTEELSPLFPGIERLRTTEARMDWSAFPFTRGSYSAYRVGQWSALRGSEGEPVGRLHFAGEHTSLEFQGSMNGGCESGEEAARDILTEMGFPLTEGFGSGWRVV